MSFVPMALVCGKLPNPVGMTEIVTRDFNPGQTAISNQFTEKIPLIIVYLKFV